VSATDQGLTLVTTPHRCWPHDDRRVGFPRPDLVETSSRLTIEQLAELRGLEPGLQLVDVRSPAETTPGTIPGPARFRLWR
jgi:hypothetical protein